MANTRQTTANKEVKEPEELNMETKVNVVSLAKWKVSFARTQDGMGTAVIIPPGGSIRLTRAEIVAQVQNGNNLFCGIDGKGSHATLYINDKATRVEVGFESEDTEQDILTDEKVKELFNLSQTKFEKALREAVVTRTEKNAIMEFIRKLELNDYKKIKVVENYTHYTL